MEALTDLAHYAGLEHLPPNIPYILASFLFFTVIHLVVAPLGSWLFLRSTYMSMDRKGRNNWCAAQTASDLPFLKLVGEKVYPCRLDGACAANSPSRVEGYGASGVGRGQGVRLE